MERAATVPGSVSVITVGFLPNGVGFLEVPCCEHTTFTSLPAAVVYRGVRYGKSGWNSDRNRAYYRTDMRIATAVL